MAECQKICQTNELFSVSQLCVFFAVAVSLYVCAHDALWILVLERLKMAKLLAAFASAKLTEEEDQSFDEAVSKVCTFGMAQNAYLSRLCEQFLVRGIYVFDFHSFLWISPELSPGQNYWHCP